MLLWKLCTSLLLPLYCTTLIYMHMSGNMCETTAPSRVKNYSGGTNRFLWGCSAPVYSQIFCTQPAICYAVKTDFFFTQQRKINCKEGREFVFILALRSRVPGWRRTAVGEGWPTRCLLPLPCLAAQSLWQNKPPGILGKHWEPLSGSRTISWEHRSQKASHFQYCLHFFL